MLNLIVLFFLLPSDYCFGNKEDKTPLSDKELYPFLRLMDKDSGKHTNRMETYIYLVEPLQNYRVKIILFHSFNIQTKKRSCNCLRNKDQKLRRIVLEPVQYAVEVNEGLTDGDSDHYGRFQSSSCDQAPDMFEII